MFTRSTARALHANRVTIHNNTRLPEEVLLEIFDAYRQLYELQPDYEHLWNSRDGWFKLTHVCLHWRRIVFLASCRLHVHLLFSTRRSLMDPVLKCLPRFPILVDYRAAFWTNRQENLALAAIRLRGRVRGIALRKPFPDILLKALTHPFPELESLEICSTHCGLYGGRGLLLPPTFLSGSAPSLRQLTLRYIALSCISSLLSFATGLVELSLTVVYCGPRDASLITNLQRMSCLRRLELKLYAGSYLPTTTRIPISTPLPVPLSKLTDLILMGPGSYLQMFVAGLVAPSLQHLDAEVSEKPLPMSIIPHLCKFVCDTECQFIAVRLDRLQEGVKFSAETSRAQSFRISLPEPVSFEQIGNSLSGPLSTVEELVVDVGLSLPTPRHRIHWFGFFNQIQRMKMVHVSSEVALGVARSFQLDGQEPALDVLPALEQIKVNFANQPIGSNIDDQYESICDAFEPLVAARKQVGRPIIISWA